MNKHNKSSQENSEYVEYFKEHAEYATEYTKSLISTIQSSSSEIAKKTTDICATNLALAKNFLNCSNFEEVVHWGENFIKTNVDNCINTAGSLYSKICNEVVEANGHIAKKLSKNINNLKNKF